MKKFLFFIAAAVVLTFAGCSNDDSNPADGGGLGGGGLGGGGNGGSVTFTVAVVQGDDGNQYLEFKPSTPVVITQVRAVCNAIGVDETVGGDGTTVFSSTEPGYVPTNGLVQSGQQWVFTVSGKLGNAQGQQYTSTVNFQVP